MKELLTYGAMTAAFLAIDSIWLGVVAKNFYHNNIGHLMAKKPNFIAAGVFYALYLTGLLVLVVLRADSYVELLWSAALFGLVGYGTYDLTSQAVIKDWPAKVTIADLFWGVFLTTSVGLVGYFVLQLVS